MTRHYFNQSDLDLHAMSSMGGFLAGVLIGALAGATAMLLLAPQSGKATRRMISNRTRELADQVEEKYDAAVDTARQRARQISKDVRSRVDEAQHLGQELLEEQKHRVEEVVKAGRQAVKRS